MNDNSVITASQMISRVFGNVESGTIENGNRIVSSWRKVVESINPDGNKLAAHSKISDLKNGILLVETDHPGWIQMLKIHEKYILKGIRNLNKDVKIFSLAFKLAGTDAGLLSKEELDKREKERFNRQIEQQEKEIENLIHSSPVNTEKKELPPQLKDLFERMKSDMLTKKD